ncbi:MAG: hypothetical protein ACTSO7_09615 [Candidatus Heimdallarchaeota archaeon]
MAEENIKEQQESIEEDTELIEDIKPKKKKDDEDEIDTSIKINSWAYLFFIVFAGIIGYIVAAYMTGLPPFITDSLGLEVVDINETVLVIFIIAGLVSLGLGYYFGWIRKKPETTISVTTKEVEDDITSDSTSNDIKEKEEEKSE